MYAGTEDYVLLSTAVISAVKHASRLNTPISISRIRSELLRDNISDIELLRPTLYRLVPGIQAGNWMIVKPGTEVFDYIADIAEADNVDTTAFLTAVKTVTTFPNRMIMRTMDTENALSFLAEALRIVLRTMIAVGDNTGNIREHACILMDIASAPEGNPGKIRDYVAAFEAFISVPAIGRLTEFSIRR